MAISIISVVGVCLCRAGGGIFSFFGFRAAARRAGIHSIGADRDKRLLSVNCVRFVASATVRRVRLLAQQSKLSADALRHSVDDSFSGLRLVPMGTSTKGIQPDHPARKYFAAGVLGAY